MKNDESEKQCILGRKEKNSEGLLNIGRYYAIDSSLGSKVHIDVLHPHVVLICGKRGYGKSYTMGVFIEEIAQLEPEVKNNLGVAVIDTLGIFWTSKIENKDKSQLERWQIEPKAYDVDLFVPKKYVNEYKNKKIDVKSYSVGVSDLSPFHWCQLFNIKATESLGIILTRAVLELQSKSKNFSIKDLLEFIKKDKKGSSEIKAAAENFLNMAESWGVFDKVGIPITDFVKRGRISILDVSHLPDSNLKVIITSILSKKIFEERVKQRKIHELKKMGHKIQEKGIPMVWLAIDEAQLFVPRDEEVLSKKVLINEWMRQGRQPGLSLLLATQRPSAVESEVMSHSDIIMCHRLTSQEDIDALSRIRPTYMHGDIKESIKKIGDERGVAFLIDDNSESTHVIKIRPRKSWHGGEESVALNPK